MRRVSSWTRGEVMVVAMVGVGAGLAAQAPLRGGRFALFADAAASVPGLTGSYVNQNLGGVAGPADWRTTQAIAGTRIDATIDFTASDWLGRSQLGLTGGTSQNWDNFSVQWDGFLRVLDDGTSLRTVSDDSSRMWIDVDGDGQFTNAFPELADNHWGTPQGLTAGEPSLPLALGTYRIRLQYEERGGGNVMRLESVAQPTVRVAYLIPSNRVAQTNGVTFLAEMVSAWQAWLCDQTANGISGPRRLRVETTASGAPQVHVVSVGVTDAFLRGDPWVRTINAAISAGVPVWQRGEIWLLVPEMHDLDAQGQLLGDVALGSGGGGDDPGVAVIGSAGIALAALGGMDDARTYGGLTIATSSSATLVQGVTFPWFAGATVGSVLSSAVGAGMHELGHALGLGHDFRNDDNFRGNLMGNGLRGFRGAFLPSGFGTDECRLAFASALVFATSRYLQPCGAGWATTGPVATDRTSPTVAFSPVSATPVLGKLTLQLQVTDDRGLATVLLARQGDTIDEMRVGGTSATVTFSSPWFESGSQDYLATVIDAAGNRATATVTVVVPAGFSSAPRPYLFATPAAPAAGQVVVLDAGGSSVPAGGPVTYEWDLDGAGVFTAPSLSPQRAVLWQEPWQHFVRVRVTDGLGNRTVSTALAVRVRSAPEGSSIVAVGAGTPGCLGTVRLQANLQPAIGTAEFRLATTNAPRGAPGFRLFGTQSVAGCVTVVGLGATCFHMQPNSLLEIASIQADDSGHHVEHIAVPGDPALRGLQVVAETVWLEGSACQLPAPRIATSNGLVLTVF